MNHVNSTHSILLGKHKEEQQIRIEHILYTNDGHGITRVNPHYEANLRNRCPSRINERYAGLCGYNHVQSIWKRGIA